MGSADDRYIGSGGGRFEEATLLQRVQQAFADVGYVSDCETHVLNLTGDFLLFSGRDPRRTQDREMANPNLEGIRLRLRADCDWQQQKAESQDQRAHRNLGQKLYPCWRTSLLMCLSAVRVMILRCELHRPISIRSPRSFRQAAPTCECADSTRCSRSRQLSESPRYLRY